MTLTPEKFMRPWLCHWIDMPKWLVDALADGRIVALNEYADRAAEIRTLEGVMRADLGDWIIRGIKGELYPCKPDIFAATYDLA